MQFLVRNVLSANAMLLHVRSGGIPDVRNLRWHHLLRNVIPPQSCLVTVIEMPEVTESVRLVPSDESETMPAFEAITDSAFAISDQLLTPRLVRGHCH